MLILQKGKGGKLPSLIALKRDWMFACARRWFAYIVPYVGLGKEQAVFVTTALAFGSDFPGQACSDFPESRKGDYRTQYTASFERT